MLRAQGCEGATGAHRLPGCAPGAHAGACAGCQARPLQEHCAGCRRRPMWPPQEHLAVAGGICYRGSCWCPLQEACAACGCGRYRSTALLPVAACCMLQGLLLVPATLGLRCLRMQPLQEHRAAAGGWCLPQGYANPCSNRPRLRSALVPSSWQDRTSVPLEHPHRRSCLRRALLVPLQIGS